MAHKPTSAPEIEPRTVTVDGFRKAVAIGRTSAYAAINNGDVESLIWRGRRLITVASIDAFIERQLQRGAR